jgi:hypothetical protein
MFVTVVEVVGFIGALAFALSGIPQAIQSIRLGTSRGMAGGTVALWMVGEVAMLAYVLAKYPSDLALVGNYSVNLLIVGAISWLWLFPRRISG